MPGRLSGKVAIVTGGNSGIGEATAHLFAREGAKVSILARREAEGHAVEAAIRSEGGECLFIPCDVMERASVDSAIAKAVAHFGRLDILINMASVYVERAFDDLTAADWNAVIDVELRGAFLCSHAAAPHMRRRGGGRIINFSDWIARSGRPRYIGYVPYYVAKSGVIALTEALAVELAAYNILVNALAPGPILAPKGTTAEELKTVEDATPLGRWGGEIEIAKVVLGLLDSDFITGETVRVDGGRHLR